MAISIVKVPESTGDLDFLAFSFKGKHSFDDFGIYRTSGGDRYDDNLMPTANELTAEVPGGDGQYYFGSFHKSKNFNISFAFDNLSEEKYREMKIWLNNKEMGELWFSEAPYKVYMVKVTGQPNLKTLCFTVDNKREYRGELNYTVKGQYFYAENEDGPVTSLTFKNTTDSDYKNPTIINSKLMKLSSEMTIEAIKLNSTKTIRLYKTTSDDLLTDRELLYCWKNGKNSDSYEGFYTKDEWLPASGLTNGVNLSQGENVGDLPSHFTLKVKGTITASDKSSLTFSVGSLSITVPAQTATTEDETTTYTHYSDIEWNSKTGLVYATIDDERKLISFSGTALGQIPIEGISNWGLKSVSGSTTTYSHENITLEYHYWYY